MSDEVADQLVGLMREAFSVQERTRLLLGRASELSPAPQVGVLRMVERQLAMAQGRLVGLSEAWELVTGRSWDEVVASGGEVLGEG